MPLAAKLTPDSVAAETVTLGTRRTSEVARDLTLLLAACLTVGLAVGLGMMLAVLVFAS